MILVDFSDKWKDYFRVREALEMLFHKPGYPAMNEAARSRLTEA